MEFTYSDELFSDLHKDVYGFRPRGVILDTDQKTIPVEIVKPIFYDEKNERLVS